jgi:hypothetical protein
MNPRQCYLRALRDLPQVGLPAGAFAMVERA